VLDGKSPSGNSPSLQFVLVMNGTALPAIVSSPATVTSTTNSSIEWSAVSTVSVPPAGTPVTLSVAATYDYTSYFTFAVTVSNAGTSPVYVDDIQLTYQVDNTTNKVGVFALLLHS
jgi:hypothetical protein